MERHTKVATGALAVVVVLLLTIAFATRGCGKYTDDSTTQTAQAYPALQWTGNSVNDHVSFMHRFEPFVTMRGYLQHRSDMQSVSFGSALSKTTKWTIGGIILMLIIPLASKLRKRPTFLPESISKAVEKAVEKELRKTSGAKPKVETTTPAATPGPEAEPGEKKKEGEKK